MCWRWSLQTAIQASVEVFFAFAASPGFSSSVSVREFRDGIALAGDEQSFDNKVAHNERANAGFLRSNSHDRKHQCCGEVELELLP